MYGGGSYGNRDLQVEMPRIKGHYGVAIYDNPTEVEYQNPYHMGKKGSRYEGMRYGIKYECVEYARRYYMHVFGVTFKDVDNAIDLFQLSTMKDIETNKRIPVKSIRNTSYELPEPGDLIIWKADGPYEITGHVAVAVRVISPTTVQVAEQNGPTANGLRNVHIHHPRIIGWLRIE